MTDKPGGLRQASSQRSSPCGMSRHSVMRELLQRPPPEGLQRRLDFVTYGEVLTGIGIVFWLAGLIGGILSVTFGNLGLALALEVLGLMFFVPGVVLWALAHLLPSQLFADPLE